jgi:hypothetical protein
MIVQQKPVERGGEEPFHYFLSRSYQGKAMVGCIVNLTTLRM